VTGRWTLSFLLARMTTKPAEVFGLNSGELMVGRDADLTIIDLHKQSEVIPADFVTKGRNTPFKGWNLQGWPTLTMVSGKVVWSVSTNGSDEHAS